MIRTPHACATKNLPTQTPPGWYCLASAAIVAAFGAALAMVLWP